jgi:triosephosphate isomerase
MPKLIVGNWKANPKSALEAKKLAQGIHSLLTKAKKTAILAVPTPFFETVKSLKSKRLILAAQDVSNFSVGAHTGEVPAEMLATYGIKYAIVGHSERRAQGEGLEVLNQKLLRLFSANITPILCVGELSREHLDRALSFIKQQIESACVGITRAKITKLVIAYEPVWAIGKDAEREATPEECKEIVIYIRKIIADIYGQPIAKEIQILYGGSVDQKNAKMFLEHGGVQGLLVGRASLDPKAFSAITSL